MLALEDLKPGQSLVGLEPNLVVTVRSVNTLAEGAVELVYRTSDGLPRTHILTRVHRPQTSLAITESPWTFLRDRVASKVIREANRINAGLRFATAQQHRGRGKECVLPQKDRGEDRYMRSKVMRFLTTLDRVFARVHLLHMSRVKASNPRKDLWKSTIIRV